jgi:hypothetical protein
MTFEMLHEPLSATNSVRSAMKLESCPPAETRFEILRATVWSMTTSRTKAHINRILSAALPTWQLLSGRENAGDETLRGDLRAALSALEDAGDLVELSGGFWIPAATRLVELPDSTGKLLVGGVPSASLPFAPGSIQFHGPHRHLMEAPQEWSGKIPVEDLKSWARLPEVPLREWARSVIESHERQTYSPSNAEPFEFYLPASFQRGAPQFFRWAPTTGQLTGTFLARRLRVYGAKEYRLVDVSAGRIVAACELYVDVRRLMYAFDLAAENPTRARCVRAEKPTEWLFGSELPRAEQRAFAALGTLTIPDGRHFERQWRFTRHEKVALQMLRDLGIALGHKAGKVSQ